MDVQQLLGLKDKAFRDLVDKEVRGEASSEVERLIRTPELRTRWITTLTSMKKSVESQIGSKKADLTRIKLENPSQYQHAVNAYQIWRAGALRFKSGVEERLLEARSSLPPEPEKMKRERNDALYRAKTLQDAIETHKTRTLDELDLDPSEADEELWTFTTQTESRK